MVESTLTKSLRKGLFDETAFAGRLAKYLAENPSELSKFRSAPFVYISKESNVALDDETVARIFREVIQRVPPRRADDDETVEALKALTYATIDKVFGPQGRAIFQKEFEAQIKDVTQPQGGTENLTNTRSPGQPSPKHVAEPAEAGYGRPAKPIGKPSDGWYDSRGSYSQVPEMARNPEGTVETKQNVPLNLYPEETRLTSGGKTRMGEAFNTYTDSLRGKGPTDKPSFKPTVDKSIHKNAPGFLKATTTPDVDPTAFRGIGFLQGMQHQKDYEREALTAPDVPESLRKKIQDATRIVQKARQANRDGYWGYRNELLKQHAVLAAEINLEHRGRSLPTLIKSMKDKGRLPGM